MKIEFSELVFEELELCDHGADEQIKGRILAVGSQLCFADSRSALAFCTPSRPRLTPMSRLASRRTESRPIAAALGAAFNTAWLALL